MTPKELAIPVTQQEMGNLLSGTKGHELHDVARRMAFQIDTLRTQREKAVTALSACSVKEGKALAERDELVRTVAVFKNQVEAKVAALTLTIHERDESRKEVERLKAEPVGCHGCTHVLCEDECELCAE